MMNWDNVYKAVMLVAMVAITVVVSHDIWAGVVVAASMGAAYWIMALIYANKAPHHSPRH